MRKPPVSGFLKVGRFSALGLELGLCVAIGLGLGWWLEERFETGGWLTLGGFFLGLAAAVLSFLRGVREIQGGAAGDDADEGGTGAA